jgi:hypothetical protein
MRSIDTPVGLDGLKTGDLVLFAGGSPASGLIRWFRRSLWTHVGLVLRCPEDSEPWLWEAHGAGPHEGTTMVRLAARIPRCRGRVAARCLNRALGERHRAHLDELRTEIAARGASRRLLDLMGAADDGFLGARPEMLGDPMDGELVAAAYQRLGLLDDAANGGLPASRYRPWQFAERHRLELKAGYALGPELVLRDPDRAAVWPAASPQTASYA